MKKIVRYVSLSLIVIVLLISCTPPASSPTISTTTSTPNPLLIDQPDIKCSHPNELDRFKVMVVNNPSFCIVWVDEFQNETGFLVTINYLNSKETFVFEAKPNITQLLIPQEYSPTSTLSHEDCLKRQVFNASVVALINAGNIEIGGTAGQGEC